VLLKNSKTDFRTPKERQRQYANMNSIREFFGQVPFFRLTIGMVAGILSASLFQIEIFPIYYLAILVFFYQFLIQFVKHDLLFSVFLLVLLSLIGLYNYNTSKPELRPDDITDKFYLVQVEDPPVEKEKTYQVIVKINSCHNHGKFEKERVLLYLEKDERSKNLLPGDYLFLHGRFSTQRLSGNPFEFDYPDFLQKKRISRTGYCTGEEWQKSTTFRFTLKRRAEICRRKIIAIYRAGNLEGQQLAILCALTLGQRDLLSRQTQLAFAESGLMHVLAVSGLHIGILYCVVNWLFSLLFPGEKGKMIKAILLIMILWSFAFISGLAPSVIRSCLMFSLIITGQSLKRKSQIYNSIFASAFLILLIDPLSLFHIGFQLSYLAVISIVFFQPRIYQLIQISNPVINKIWGLLAVAIAAQIGTLPISLYYFHQFPNYFWLSNIIAIPLVSIILHLAIILILISPFSSLIPYLGMVVSKTITFLLKISIWVENLPGAVCRDNYPDKEQVLLMYLFILFMTGYIIVPKNKIRLHLALLALLGISGIQLNKIIHVETQRQLIIYNDPKHLIINLISGKENYLLTDSSVKDPCSIRRYIEPVWKNQKTNSPTWMIFNAEKISIPDFFYSHPFIWHDNKVMIIADKILNLKALPENHIANQLLITRQSCLDSANVSLLAPEQIILSPNCYQTHLNYWAQNRNNKMPHFIIRNKGAWIYNFRTNLKK